MGSIDARPIFVVGNSRSGTTMVARMLGAHPAVHTLRELHFVEELWDPADGDPPLSSDDAQRLVERLLHRARVGYNLPFVAGAQATDARRICAAAPAGATAPDLFWAVLDDAATADGAARPCEQTPRNVHFVAPLLERFPEARIVAVVREPRDVVLSQRNWWRRGAFGATEQTWRTSVRRYFGYHPIITTLLWRGGVRAGDAIHDERLCTVRFEDVVADPDVALREVSGHVGIDFDPVMLEVPRYNSSNRADPGGTGVDPSVVGAGAAQLSGTEQWIVLRMTRAERARHGYSATAARPTLRGLVAVALSLGPKVAVTALTNLRRSGSPVRSVVRRLRA